MKKESGQSLVLVAISLIGIAVIATWLIYGKSASDNMAETILDSSNSESSYIVMEWDSELEADILFMGTHADWRHGEEAEMARECSKRDDSLKFFNPNTRRTAFICEIKGIFGIHILNEFFEEVTAFLKKQGNKTLETNVTKVIEYMQRGGYIPVEW